MISTKTARLALAAATALTAFGAPASAQQIDRIVAFGDSYADDDNFFQLAAIPPASTVIYTTGRFSGGTNYVDTLGQILQVPIDNFAIGGAQSGISNTNNPFNWGFTYEVDQFLNVGPQSTIFPATTAPFRSTDLVTVSIGGNDARGYQQGGGTLVGASAAATVAAGLATGNLNRLVAAGAPTISFLAGDTGRLPEIAGNPTGAAIRTSYSNTFNTSLQGTLSGYANNGVIVHYLDLNQVLNNINANPAAFGITNGLVCPIFPSPTCVTNSSGYLFYGDALHLTSDGFKIVARYVAAQLAAPLTMQAPSDSAMNVGQQFGRTLTSRLDLSAPRDGDQPEGFHAYVVGDAYSRTAGATLGNQHFASDTIGVTVGADYGFGSGVIGIAGNYSKPKIKFGTGDADLEGHSYQIGAYGGFGVGGAFAQGYIGYGWDSHKFERAGVISDITSSPKGNHWIAGGKAGYLMSMGSVRVGPVVGLDYARAKVDGYTETGDAALTLNVGSARYSSLRGTAGAELRGDFGGGGVQFRPYIALVAEKELGSRGRSISFSQTDAPIIVNRFNFDDVSKKIYGRGTIGATAQIFSHVSIDSGISMTAGKKQGNETSGHLGIRVGF